MGLSIVKKLVELMDGHVSVKSKVGEGTTFSVILPFNKDNSENKTENKDLNLSNAVAVIADKDECANDYAEKAFNAVNVRVEKTDLEHAESKINQLLADNALVKYLFVGIYVPQDAFKARELADKFRSLGIKTAAVSFERAKVEKGGNAAAFDAIINKPVFKSDLYDCLAVLEGKRQKIKKTHKFDFSGKRILIAEDNEMNAVVAEGLLKKVHAECDKAFNGKVACEKFAAAPIGYYDLVLMDVQMPVMDGYTATKTIRELKRSDAEITPILAMTANAFDDDVKECLKVGMNAHIAKPIEPLTLYSTIAKYLNAVKK